MATPELPFLDSGAPGFSTRSEDVLSARDRCWCARTPLGYAVLRHRQAGMLLRDRRLRQGSHAWPDTVGIEGDFADFWRRSIISQEGDMHRTLRRIAQSALSEDFVLSLELQFAGIAASLAFGLEAQSSFDFVEEFSEPFAGRAIAMLLGLPETDAAALARDASTLGLAMGPNAKQHEEAVNQACLRLSVLAEHLIDGGPAGSFVARASRAAQDAGLQDRQALIDLIVIAIFGGVDTTRAQLAFAVVLFARHKNQWTWLRENPGAVPQAIEEVIRTWPTTTWATREALVDFDFDGIPIRAGDTLHIYVHASGTDPAAGVFDGFDIRAARKSHFGFGGGAHHCLGQFVARTDMAAALSALLLRWKGITLAEEPQLLPDSGNTSPRSLRISPDWA